MIMKTENRNGNQRNTKKNQNKNETAKKLQGLIKDIIHSAYEKAVEKDRFNPMFRQCGKMPDEDFFFYCVMRAMGEFESGRAFLQILSLKNNTLLPRTRFFSALQSKRRGAVVRAMANEAFHAVEKQLALTGIDFFGNFPELKEYALFNGDGHYIKHSAHTVPKKKKKYAAGTLYIQSLRAGSLIPLCSITDGDSKPHEMPLFKGVMEATDPFVFFGYKKVLHVLDMAYVNNRWWGEQKKRGYYVVTRLKKSAKPLKSGDLPFDRDDPINKGVKASYQAGMFCGYLFRVVEYTDPETGEAYSFVTNLENQIRPGLIAWLYFNRWKIEKNFDTTKNTMAEKKAWAKGKGALSIQSHAIAFAYNIMRLFHETIAKEQKEQGNRETLSERKYRKALAKRRERATREGREVHPLLATVRMARIPSAFVRCFRMCFFDNVSLNKTWGLLTNTLYCQL